MLTLGGFIFRRIKYILSYLLSTQKDNKGKMHSFGRLNNTDISFIFPITMFLLHTTDTGLASF